MLSPKKLLENARNRISKRENWTQGKFARDSHGRLCSVLDPNAACWCAIGAVAAEAGYNARSFDGVPYGRADHLASGPPPESENFNVAIMALARVSPEYNPEFRDIALPHDRYDVVYSANDKHEHEIALKMFDDAIASLRGE